MMSIFGENTTISNSKVEKRPRNFYRANGDTLGDFQTESVIIRGSYAERQACDTGWPNTLSAQAQLQSAPKMGSLFRKK